MIRVATFEPFEEADVRFVCEALYKAFGVGAEIASPAELPTITLVDGALPADELLTKATPPRGFADDKALFLTRQKLTQAKGPLGVPPTHGFAHYGKDRAVVTTALFGRLAELSEEFQKRLARQAVHEVGHLWDLHACLEPKCSMHPPWAEAFALHDEPILCNYCREKSESRIQLARR